MIVKVSKKLFWRSVCLDKAVAGTILLKRRGIPSTFHLGLAKKEKFEAHAWITCGDVIVTGGKTHEQFTPISSFN